MSGGVGAAQVLQAYEKGSFAMSKFAKKGFSAAAVYAEMLTGGKIDGKKAKAVCQKYGISYDKIESLINSNAGSAQYMAVLNEQNPAAHTDKISQMLAKSGKLPAQQGQQGAKTTGKPVSQPQSYDIAQREQQQQQGNAGRLWQIA